MNNKKKFLIISIIASVFAILAIGGFTYAYYMSTITGTPKQVTGTTANLSLKFDNGDGNISGTNLYPGWSISKKFTVQNTGTAAQKFNIVVNSATNTIGDNFKYALCRGTTSCNLITAQCSSTNNTNCRIVSGKWPAAAATLVSLEPVALNTTNSYILYMEYTDTNKDQNTEMGKSFGGTLTITSAKYTNANQAGTN